MDWNWLSGSRRRASQKANRQQDAQRLLENEEQQPSYPALEVTKVALRLKYQIEQVVPCELEEWKITKANSPVITPKVIQAAKEAGGKEYASCVIYCLLVCLRWFQRQAALELWDADLFAGRATACEVLAKKIIESEGNEDFLMQEYLLRRYSILVRGRATDPANAIERAVDLHALRIIGSSGYQKCVSFLWRGWLTQDEFNPSRYIEYANKANGSYWAHFDPDRMRTPQFQNAVQISVSLVYLVLYTIAINTINKSADIDVIEAILYVFTAGFIFDEIAKLWKGWYYISFWNVFNCILYTLLVISLALRLVALSFATDSDLRYEWNALSYNFLAFSAPMFWTRLLLYLDALRFFGAMLVILKVMMKESAIFFLLLVLLCVGFLQAFIGLDAADDNQRITADIVQAMLASVMQSPDFGGWVNRFAPPFGLILYYLFTFVVMVILLNILIALYNSAYENVTDNAVDEYMALFASKTMQFVRAPDENVFIAPFNLLEIFLLIIPFEWWLSAERYEYLNDIVMTIIYMPLLAITAWLEARAGRRVQANRRNHQADEDTVEEWEQLGQVSSQEGASMANGGDEEEGRTGELIDFEADGWAKKVERTRPNVEVDATMLEVQKLREQVKELADMVKAMKEGSG